MPRQSDAELGVVAWAVTTRLERRAVTGWADLRRLHHEPFPDQPGLIARRVSRDARGGSVRYLFESAQAAAEVSPTPARPVYGRSLTAPILVVAPPRSGSTALFDGLAAHPTLRSLGAESEGVIEGVPALHPAAGGYRSHRLTADDVGRAASPTASSTAGHAVCSGFLADLPSDAGSEVGRRLVEKTPENALRLPFLLTIFPDAVIVCLHRDRGDTVASMVRAWRHPGFVNIPELPGWRRGGWHLLLPPDWHRLGDVDLSRVASFQWTSATEGITDARRLVPSERWLDLDYEEFRVAPARTLRRLYAALGLRPVVPPPDLPLSATTMTPPRPPRRSRTLAGERKEQSAMPTRTSSTRRVFYACWLTDQPSGTARIARGELRVDVAAVLQGSVTVPLPLARRTRFRDGFQPDNPILWVTDLFTGGLRPYWLRPEEYWAARAFVPGQPPPVPPVDPLRGRLIKAGVLITDYDRQERIAAADRAAATCGEEFAHAGLCEVDGLIGDGHRVALARYYEDLIDSGSWSIGDAQVAGRYGWQNEPMSRFFHHQLTGIVGRLVGEPVRPSYSYVSAYRAGAVLDRHRDREQCEYTVSLLIAESGPGVAGGWPLLFDTAEGTVSITQHPGQAVLFRGTALPHYRPPLPDGNTHLSLLFHYVPAGFRRTLY